MEDKDWWCKMSAIQRYDALQYEKILKEIMEKINADEYDFDYTRRDAWVVLSYKGSKYRLELSIQSAAEHGQALMSGADAFCKIVMALDSLTRTSSQCLSALQQWVEGSDAVSEPSQSS